MKKLISIVTIMFCAVCAYSQDFIDNALLFSRVKPAGSARIQAMGGAQTALGGDYSSALSNPAGLGMFNRSEFTITPAITSIGATSSYFGEETKDSRQLFNLPGLSLVINTPSGNDKGFLGGSFGISLTRINDLNLNYTFSGVNDQNSIIDYFISDAYGRDPEDLLNGQDFYSLTGLAYNNYLIEDFDDNGTFVYDSRLAFASSRQTEVAERKGAQYQWSIAYGANFSDKFFAGATLGIATLRYKLRLAYRESELGYPEGAETPASEFSTSEDYDIKGAGVNFALGTIYRPVDFLQFGLSFTTPTWYSLSDTYTATAQSEWNNYQYYPDTQLNSVSVGFDQPLVSQYNFTSPMKLNMGVAFLSKFGLVSADVERVNYSRAKYKSSIDDDFDFENQGIRGEYGATTNYRLGAEYRLKSYRVRAGYSHQGDPIKEGADRSLNSFSGGLGYRARKFYIDFAAVYSTTEGNRIPYFVSGTSPVANQKFTYANYLLTVGFPF
jgi:hypothetical protein